MAANVGMARLRPLAAAAAVFWLGGVSFIGYHYVQDTVSGRLGDVVERTWDGERRRIEGAPSSTAAGPEPELELGPSQLHAAQGHTQAQNPSS
jgi:hypothetical protein